MAYEVPVLDHSFTMNVSSTAKQFYLVKHTTAANSVTLTSTVGDETLGVIQEPTSSGGIAPVRLLGITKVAHDGTLVPGSQVMASSVGLATIATTGVGVFRLGMCFEAPSTVSGTLATFFLAPIGTSTA